MIPNSITFADRATWVAKALAMEPIQTASGNVNVNSIAYYGHERKTTKGADREMNIFAVTIATCTSTAWRSGMKVTLANTTAWDGTYEIKYVDYTNKILYIWADRESQYVQTGAAGTATAAGVIRPELKSSGISEIYNGDGDFMVYQYTAAGSFFFQAAGEDIHAGNYIQVVNSGTGSATVTLTYSLDGVNFVAFSTAITGTVASGASAIFALPQLRSAWVQVAVSGVSIQYYVILL